MTGIPSLFALLSVLVRPSASLGPTGSWSYFPWQYISRFVYYGSKNKREGERGTHCSGGAEAARAAARRRLLAMTWAATAAAAAFPLGLRRRRRYHHQHQTDQR